MEKPDFSGVWDCSEQSNVDEMSEVLGIPANIRESISNTKPKQIITQHGNILTVETQMGPTSFTSTSALNGEEFTTTFMKHKEFKGTAKWDADGSITSSGLVNGKHKMSVNRKLLRDDIFQLTITLDHVVCTRVFKKK